MRNNHRGTAGAAKVSTKSKIGIKRSRPYFVKIILQDLAMVKILIKFNDDCIIEIF